MLKLTNGMQTTVWVLNRRFCGIQVKELKLSCRLKQMIYDSCWCCIGVLSKTLLNKFSSFAVKIGKYMLIQVSPGGITVKLPVSLTTLFIPGSHIRSEKHTTWSYITSASLCCVTCSVLPPSGLIVLVKALYSPSSTISERYMWCGGLVVEWSLEGRVHSTV